VNHSSFLGVFSVMSQILTLYSIKVVMWFSGMNMMAPSTMRCVLATLNSSYYRDMRQLFAVLQTVHLQVDSCHLIIWHFSVLLPGRTKLPGLIFSEQFTYMDKQLCDSTPYECNNYGFLPLELCKGIAFVEQRCSWILLL
jgi:hypothetical protein